MNRSARGLSVKRFEQSYGPDTALYKNVPLLYLYLTLTGSEVHRVGAATEKALLQCVLTLGTKGRWELDDLSSLGCLARANSDSKYASCIYGKFLSCGRSECR